MLLLLPNGFACFFCFCTRGTCAAAVGLRIRRRHAIMRNSCGTARAGALGLALQPIGYVPLLPRHCTDGNSPVTTHGINMHGHTSGWSHLLCRQPCTRASMHTTARKAIRAMEGVILTLAVPAVNIVYHPSASPARPLLRTARPKAPGSGRRSRSKRAARGSSHSSPLWPGDVLLRLVLTRSIRRVEGDTHIALGSVVTVVAAVLDVETS